MERRVVKASEERVLELMIGGLRLGASMLPEESRIRQSLIRSATHYDRALRRLRQQPQRQPVQPV